MTTKNLLVELFVEELPPKALKKLGESFAATLSDSLKAQGLAAADSAVTAYASPRRLAVQVANVAAKAADKPVSQKLMPVSVGLDASGNATPALLKRLAGLGAGAEAVAQLKRAPDGKNEALFYDSLVAGATLADGLQKALDEALAKLPIPKVMGYQLADGWSTVNFVRPAHGLVALHGSDVVPISVLGLTAGNTTQGHRFEAANPTVTLNSADSYAEQLATEGAVIASFESRRAEIVRQLNAAADAQGLKPIEDDDLLNEVTALVERPNVLLGQFEEAFLEVPQECLILTMKANQKYFPLLDANGKLTNQFLIVSNIRPADPSLVIGGNERVVRPRLADAKFFFDQDRKKTLESRVLGLAKVVYHNKLGTQGERVQRVCAIAKAIGQQLGGDTLALQAEQAALLAKADLLTDMVGEFPELQGIMGRYYAQHDGLPDDIAYAIEDHYKPRFAGDELPRNPVGLCVALADKLETLVGMFGIGQLPTGDKDPFALRRHALGVIRMLVERKLVLSIEQILKAACNAFPDGLLQPTFDEGSAVVPLWVKIHSFLLDRASGYLRDRGYSAQEADSVICLAEPAEFIARLHAVRQARESFPAELSALASADKRARNILNKSGGASEYILTDENVLIEKAEKILLSKTRQLRTTVDEQASKGNFDEALFATVTVSQAVTEFFDTVMVNADVEELRLNRFRLLHEVVGLTNRVANLSKLAA
ncbi:glycine--tRNA ligase subunit beta [Ferriphaselus sp. R-1]|uniref:glycine--tRNA ligase subunit beta n=1 Tax=Ferriphaselus sp. R-1 TaxID=1485544 RepID=UPI00055463A6|nr:glycine--tRNA ligase subunit beta [Ferriphaselus sp. R-1]